MGVVFRAEDPMLGREVALKVMNPALAADEANRERFLREARAVASLKHDHVVTIHQVGVERGIPFLAMQLLQGEILQHRLMSETALPLPEVLRIGREIAEGLTAVHAGGLIHRDIKPSNVWLEQGSGRVKILDFGLARPLTEDQPLTLVGGMVGTPAYMSPEQSAGGPLDARGDIFSLGCVLYQMATGRMAFGGGSPLRILQALATANPPPPHKLAPSIPRSLSALIMRLLAKNPNDRPGSAAEVVAELAAIEGTLKRPQQRPVGPRRAVSGLVAWARRRPLSAALAGACTVAALAALAFWAGLW
jgi:serine/threonine protein kinase